VVLTAGQMKSGRREMFSDLPMAALEQSVNVAL